MTTANKITLARILMIPLFVMMAIYYGRGVIAGEPQEWQRWCAAVLFVVAAASDGVDGYIARHYNQRSRLGVILDPIADKGLLLAGVVTLSVSNWRFEFPSLVSGAGDRARRYRRRRRPDPAFSQRHRARSDALDGESRDGFADGGNRLHHAATGPVSPETFALGSLEG